MRILTVAALLLGFISASKAANDGPWCYRDSGGPEYTSCSYYSIKRMSDGGRSSGRRVRAQSQCGPCDAEKGQT